METKKRKERVDGVLRLIILNKCTKHSYCFMNYLLQKETLNLLNDQFLLDLTKPLSINDRYKAHIVLINFLTKKIIILAISPNHWCQIIST